MRIQKKSSIHSKQSCLIPKQVLLLCILHTDVWTMRTCKFYWPKSPWWLSLHLFFLFEVFLLFYLVVVFLRPLLGQRYRCVRNRRVCILRLPNAISLTTGFSTCACACPWKCVRGRVRVCVRHKGKKLTPPVCVCVCVCRFGENTCLSPSSTSVDKLSFICVFVQVFFRVA